MRRFVVGAIFIAWGLVLAGCDGLLPNHGRDAGTADPCNTAAGPAPVAGIWRITGSGSRDNCSRQELNADSFDLTSMPLSVAQDTSGALTVTESGSFSFTGNVNGTCIAFTTSEADIEYQWQATVKDAKHLAGTLTGTGPGNCRSTGRFDVEIE